MSEKIGAPRMTREIVWTGEEKFIPGHGMARPGEKKTLPVELADNYIEQRLAQKPGKAQSKTQADNEEAT